jgi:hemin uptake protein HemP
MMKCEIESVSRKTHDSFPKPRTILSAELLSGQREVLIAHCQEVYRLRLTRNDKLILTK